MGVYAVGRMRYLRLSRRGRFTIWITLTTTLLTAVCIGALAHMKPIVTNLAVARVSNTVNRIVVAAVNEAVGGGAIDYDKLVSLEKDDTGRVTALRSNMGEVNRLQTAIADDILQRLGEVSTSELSIPVGTLTGSALLAGRGPSLQVRMQAVGSTAASFRNEFTAAGINQTKHQIILQIDVYMRILLPGFTTSTRIANEISVAETVIVGSVPNQYTSFSTMPDELRPYAEDYILNNG
ncbi:MAG: sporulation protein YunB [Oscillospiraceae bacterium]|nr:sporulation protein YunB [Oscillospiraceae bacterium]